MLLVRSPTWLPDFNSVFNMASATCKQSNNRWTPSAATNSATRICHACHAREPLSLACRIQDPSRRSRLSSNFTAVLVHQRNRTIFTGAKSAGNLLSLPSTHRAPPETRGILPRRQAVIFDSQVLSVQLPLQSEDDSSKQTTAMHRPLPAYEEPEFKIRAVIHDCQVMLLQYTCSRDSGQLQHSLQAHAVCLDCQVLTMHHRRPETLSLRQQLVQYDCQVLSVQLSLQPKDVRSKRPMTRQQERSLILQHNPYTIPEHQTNNRWSVPQDESECQHHDDFKEHFEEDAISRWHTEQKKPKFASRRQNNESLSILSYRCKDCKTTFQMSTDQVHWFLQHALHVPKRCEECRRKHNCSEKGKKIDAKPLQITEYPHKTPKSWPAVIEAQEPKSPSTVSNCSSRTPASSGITGRFGDGRCTVSNISSKSPSSSFKQTRTCWAISEGIT